MPSRFVAWRVERGAPCSSFRCRDPAELPPGGGSSLPWAGLRGSPHTGKRLIQKRRDEYAHQARHGSPGNQPQYQDRLALARRQMLAGCRRGSGNRHETGEARQHSDRQFQLPATASSGGCHTVTSTWIQVPGWRPSAPIERSRSPGGGSAPGVPGTQSVSAETAIPARSSGMRFGLVLGRTNTPNRKAVGIS